jgi:alginate O-acetyltransferase complex protein AlgI
VKGLFGFGGVPFVSAPTLYYLRSYAVVFLVALVGSTPLVKKCLAALQKRVSGEKLLNLAEPIALCVLLVVMTGYLVDGSFSPFLYFRF